MDNKIRNKYNFDELKEKVREKLKSSNNPRWENRFVHSLGVSRCAGELSKIYSEDVYEKAIIAGLVHDYCKYLTFDDYKKVCEKNNLNIELDENFTHVYHSLLAPYVIKEELGIDDEEILQSIKSHQMGRPNMGLLEMIIFVSDEAEETRVGDIFLKTRKIAFQDLYKAVAFVAKINIEYLLSKNSLIYPLSFETYNYYCKYGRFK